MKTKQVERRKSIGMSTKQKWQGSREWPQNWKRHACHPQRRRPPRSSRPHTNRCAHVWTHMQTLSNLIIFLSIFILKFPPRLSWSFWQISIRDFSENRYLVLLLVPGGLNFSMINSNYIFSFGPFNVVFCQVNKLN